MKLRTMVLIGAVLSAGCAAVASPMQVAHMAVIGAGSGSKGTGCPIPDSFTPAQRQRRMGECAAGLPPEQWSSP